jgi:glycosyltransferase involved in cell wall biosynthesis
MPISLSDQLAVERCWAPHKVETLVSIYTATYNTGEALWAAFKSLEAQTYTNWEWVIVDDASTDGITRGILRDLETHQKIRILIGTGDRKVGSMKDQASRLCRGEIFVELDHDDLLVPNALAEIVRAFKHHPDVDYVYGNLAYFDGKQPIKRSADIPQREVQLNGKTWYEIQRADLAERVCGGEGPESLWGWNCPGAPLHPQAFRAKAFWELGGYNYALSFGEDYDLTLRFMLNRKWHHIDKLLYVYRWHEGNASYNRGMEIWDWFAFVQKHYVNEVHAFSRKLKTAKEDVDRFSNVSVVVVDETGGMAAVDTMESIAQFMSGAQRILVETNGIESQVGALAHHRVKHEESLLRNIAQNYGAQYARNEITFFPDFDIQLQEPPKEFIKTVTKHGCSVGVGLGSAWPTQTVKRWDNKILVSIIVATYKRSELLNRALASIYAQKDVDFDRIEIVVVGDCCPELTERLGMNSNNPITFTSDYNVKVFNLKTNHNDLGALARNHGIINATGKYIAYLDDDNAWEPNHLSSLLVTIKDAAWAFSWMKIHDKIFKFTGDACGQIDTSALLHKRELIFKYGLWDPFAVAGYAHDWELVKRWLAVGLEGNCTYCPTLNYNIETENGKRSREAIRNQVEGMKKGTKETLVP